MEKRIDVTVGYKIVEDGKPTRYFADQTDNGMCYKDLDAYKNNDDICYIPECEFDEKGWSVHYKEGLGYAREEILDMVANTSTWDWELPISNEFHERIADYVMQEVSWESIGVLIDRIDFVEEWNEFNTK